MNMVTRRAFNKDLFKTAVFSAVSAWGFEPTSIKLKAGVFPPDYEIKAFRADYLEGPVYGLNGLRRIRYMVRIPLAANTVFVNFEQFSANVLDTGVDVILLDTTFWGGIRPCIKATGVCETFQLGVTVYSSVELDIQLAIILHSGAVIPNLSYAADAHYHHLTDGGIEGGLMRYESSSLAVPDVPGLGVKLDREKLRQYQELYKELGRYPSDQDPLRLDWAPVISNDRWADPKNDLRSHLRRPS